MFRMIDKWYLLLKLIKAYGEEFDQTIRRIVAHPGVIGCVITQNQRQPIFTTMDNNKTFQLSNRLCDFQEAASNAVRNIDPEDELVVVRIKTNKYEIMQISPTKNQSIIVVQSNTIG